MFYLESISIGRCCFQHDASRSMLHVLGERGIRWQGALRRRVVHAQPFFLHRRRVHVSMISMHALGKVAQRRRLTNIDLPRKLGPRGVSDGVFTKDTGVRQTSGGPPRDMLSITNTKSAARVTHIGDLQCLGGQNPSRSIHTDLKDQHECSDPDPKGQNTSVCTQTLI